MLFCSMQQINNVQTDISAIATCKAALLTEMAKRFGNIELCTPIAFATLLDPRFKNLNFQNASACGTAIQKLRHLLDAELSSSSGEDSDNKEVEKNKNYSLEFWSHHTNIVHGKKNKITRSKGRS